MRTAIRIFIFLIIASASQVMAQGADSVYRNTLFERYWTKPRLVPKAGLGMQDRGFVEVGLQWHNIYKHPLTLISKGPYTTVDVFIDDSNILVGPKLGYEITVGVVGFALDATYFIDYNYDGENHTRNAWVTTPKAGFTILGFADLFYGYSIPLSKQTIDSVSRNRLSLLINLNRDYFNIKEARRKKK
jgi:hypothetical protein